jgi:hypothetical protein
MMRASTAATTRSQRGASKGNTAMSLGFSAADKSDLVEYLKSL